MAEYYPGQNSESGSSEPVKKKNETKGGSRFEMPTTTPRQEIKKIEKTAGYETLKFGEGLKPLGEGYKPEVAPSKPDVEIDPTLTEIEKGMKELQADRYREISAEELRVRAAQDAAEQLAHHHKAMFETETEQESKEDSDDVEDDESPVSTKRPSQPVRVEPTQGPAPESVAKADRPAAEQVELSPQERQESDRILEQNTPELIVETSGENLGANELPTGMFRASVGRPDASPNPPEVPHAPVAEQASPAQRGQPETVVTAAAKSAAEQADETVRPAVDEHTQPGVFNMWVRNEHPELNAPEMVAASNSDEGFDDIVRNSLGGNPPGETRYYEQVPGQPPVDAGGGHNQPPNFPPTAEGGAWDDGNRPNHYYANVGHTPNPNVLNNPWALAGGAANLSTWATIGALQARNEINNLKHASREIGLAGAVGLLGLGLVADHLWARRRLKNQQNQIKELGKQQDKTAETLQQEQSAHQVTRHKLERVSGRHSEEDGQLGDRLHGHHDKKIEAGVAAGFAAAMIPGPEKALLNPAVKTEQVPAAQSPEMLWYKKNANASERTVERFPQPQTAEFAGAAATLGTETSTANEQPAFNKEGTHEQLQNQYLDAAGVKKRTSSATDDVSTPVPAVPAQTYDTSYNQSVEPYGNWADQQDRVNSPYMKPAIAGVVVFVVVLILLFVFAR